jgi:hypothetical protein
MRTSAMRDPRPLGPPPARRARLMHRIARRDRPGGELRPYSTVVFRRTPTGRRTGQLSAPGVGDSSARCVLALHAVKLATNRKSRDSTVFAADEHAEARRCTSAGFPLLAAEAQSRELRLGSVGS